MVVPFSVETAQYFVIWGFWEDLGDRTGQNPSWSFPPISRSLAEFPQCALAQHRMGSAGVGHVEKGDYSVSTWKEKHWTAGKHCRLRAAAIHKLGKLCGPYLLHSC